MFSVQCLRVAHAFCSDQQRISGQHFNAKKINISSNKPNQDMSELEESTGCKLSKYDTSLHFIQLPHPTDRPPSSVVRSFIFLNIQLS